MKGVFVKKERSVENQEKCEGKREKKEHLGGKKELFRLKRNQPGTMELKNSLLFFTDRLCLIW
ncbi:hypothetical protein AS29_005510 [Bacillus sp. SJS]|nr:hypothetical protein AS29_005510 [Bacillus sp. SJS]